VHRPKYPGSFTQLALLRDTTAPMNHSYRDPTKRLISYLSIFEGKKRGHKKTKNQLTKNLDQNVI